MSGNVWEWTRSLWKGYPYDPADGRENLAAGLQDARVVRGGAFYFAAWDARCACRLASSPSARNRSYGIRVVASPVCR